jgi:hypothetical protein
MCLERLLVKSSGNDGRAVGSATSPAPTPHPAHSSTSRRPQTGSRLAAGHPQGPGLDPSRTASHSATAPRDTRHTARKCKDVSRHLPTVSRDITGEPVTGIEPACPAWEAGALPLSYTGVRHRRRSPRQRARQSSPSATSSVGPLARGAAAVSGFERRCEKSAPQRHLPRLHTSEPDCRAPAPTTGSAVCRRSGPGGELPFAHAA